MKLFSLSTCSCLLLLATLNHQVAATRKRKSNSKLSEPPVWTELTAMTQSLTDTQDVALFYRKVQPLREKISAIKPKYRDAMGKFLTALVIKDPALNAVKKWICRDLFKNGKGSSCARLFGKDLSEILKAALKNDIHGEMYADALESMIIDPVIIDHVGMIPFRREFDLLKTQQLTERLSTLVQQYPMDYTLVKEQLVLLIGEGNLFAFERLLDHYNRMWEDRKHETLRALTQKLLKLPSDASDQTDRESFTKFYKCLVERMPKGLLAADLELPKEDESWKVSVLKNRHLLNAFYPHLMPSNTPFEHMIKKFGSPNDLEMIEFYAYLTSFHHLDPRKNDAVSKPVEYVVRWIGSRFNTFDSMITALLHKNLRRLLNICLAHKSAISRSNHYNNFALKYMQDSDAKPLALAEVLAMTQTSFVKPSSDGKALSNPIVFGTFDHVFGLGVVCPCGENLQRLAYPKLLQTEPYKNSLAQKLYLRFRFSIPFDAMDFLGDYEGLYIELLNDLVKHYCLVYHDSKSAVEHYIE